MKAFWEGRRPSQVLITSASYRCPDAQLVLPRRACRPAPGVVAPRDGTQGLDARVRHDVPARGALVQQAVPLQQGAAVRRAMVGPLGVPADWRPRDDFHQPAGYRPAAARYVAACRRPARYQGVRTRVLALR